VDYFKEPAMKLFSTIKTLLAISILVVAIPVLAMNLQQAMNALSNAKEQGLVGEQPNGYLGAVNGNAESTEIVRLINEARRAQYQRLAKDNGLVLQDVEAMAGLKAIERTNSNHYILVNGKWAKKP
jgi:uncharacterized protein YdbL (DUF1318 family)